MIRVLGFCLLAMIAGAMGAHAQWSQDQRTEFINDCVQACQTNPNVHSSRRGECPAYCQCALDANQIAYPDYQAADDEIRRDPKSPILKRFSDNNAMCSKRVFGG